MVFIYDEEASVYSGLIPDLILYCEGDTIEKVYENARQLMQYYFELATKYETEIPEPSTLDRVAEKWPEYKISLIAAETK
jgi:predicted RNase H-like HicB family nuclease